MKILLIFLTLFQVSWQASSPIFIEDYHKVFADIMDRASPTASNRFNHLSLRRTFAELANQEATPHGLPLISMARFFMYYLPCFQNKKGIFEELASMGWDGYVEHESGETYLHTDSVFGFPDVLTYAMDLLPIDVSSELAITKVTPLVLACQTGYYEAAKIFLIRGHAEFGPKNCTSILVTVLKSSKYYRKREFLTFLLTLGVSLSDFDSSEISLALAKIFREYNSQFNYSIQILQELGFDPNIWQSILVHEHLPTNVNA